MSNNTHSSSQKPTSSPTPQHRQDGGGAPGPKYTIPCPKPKK